jgi:hypothetical protein
MNLVEILIGHLKNCQVAWLFYYWIEVAGTAYCTDELGSRTKEVSE